MFFLNLALGQLLIAAGAISAFTVALYLLDRSRRKQVVSTLRFWTQANQPVQTSRRRMIRQPLSLLLQLAGILLLLLAIAQPRIGNPFSRPGYDVLILDTSAWMSARQGGVPLMDTARKRALQWLSALPAADRVMLVRADALATPATAFETDHSRVRSAIAGSEPGATALDVNSAIQFARRAQANQHASGEVAYVGSGRVRSAQDAGLVDGKGLRFIHVADQIENVGLRRASVARSATESGAWDVLTTVRNYGLHAHTVNLNVGFDRAPVGARLLTLAPGAEQEAAFTVHASQSGLLEARITPGDAFPDDDRAEVLIPALPRLQVTVYTARPDVVRPLLAANALVESQFRSPGQYRTDRHDVDTIWIDPPAGLSPVRVTKTVRDPKGIRVAGLQSRDLKLASASVFATNPGDVAMASVDDGPVIVARPGTHKTVVVGFDPGAAGTRYQLAIPLVFANILRWINPETFQQSGVNLQAAGSVAMALPGEGPVEVKRADGSAAPFSVDHHTLHLFSGSRDNLRVITPGREQVFALTLPEMWDARWEPPAGVIRGLPHGASATSPPREVWPWLAVLGAACLIAEWILYARLRRARLRAVPAPVPLRRVS
jgi:hypothetical protein